MSTQFPPNNMLEDIFTEIAIRIQLPPSKYRLACERYKTIADYLERDGSPLKDQISRFYPQGSMAIGATISSRGHDQEYDIDIVGELLLPSDTPPKIVLDTLHTAIKGEKGSRYYDMVKRRTRCVTIYYEDGMHLDVTPVILQSSYPERTSDLFHDDPDKPHEEPAKLLMNAWGFCTLFKTNTADTTSFADRYSRSVRTFDVLAKAETEEVDPQKDPSRKSSDVVALQLIKRFRNIRYGNRDERLPPSILLSKFVNDAANPMDSLVGALIYHTTFIRQQLVGADRSFKLVHEVNPTCKDDCFTDRWPLKISAQRQFISDLDYLLDSLKKLKNSELSIDQIQNLLADLFGEFPVKAAIRATQDMVGNATRSGSTSHKIGGGILLGATTSSLARGAKANTNMGGDFPE